MPSQGCLPIVYLEKLKHELIPSLCDLQHTSVIFKMLQSKKATQRGDREDPQPGPAEREGLQDPGSLERRLKEPVYTSALIITEIHPTTYTAPHTF